MQNRVYENLSFRAVVIAWLKACVLYVANGCRWEPETEDYIRWCLQYDLWCKMEFFGDEIQQSNAESGLMRSSLTNKRNLLAMLDDTFSYQAASQVRLSRGLDEKGTSNMLRQWVFRKFIKRIGRDLYQKM